MIDPTKDELLTPNEALKHWFFRNPRTGSPAHLSTFYRAVERGFRARNGTTHKLEVIRMRSGVMTTTACIDALAQAMQSAPVESPRPRSRRRPDAQVEKRLEKMKV